MGRSVGQPELGAETRAGNPDLGVISAEALYPRHAEKGDVKSFLSLKEDTMLQEIILNIRTM